MDTSSKVKQFFVELALWLASNVLSVAFPVALIYVILYGVFDVHLAKVGLFMTLATVFASTWGSWSAQIWSQNRVLRGAMRFVTSTPGFLLMALGGVGFYFVAAKWYIWAVFMAVGVATVALAFMLSREIAKAERNETFVGRATGVLLFPLASTALASGVGYLWYGYVTSSSGFGIDWLFDISTYAVTVLAIVLVSTVIPAATSLVCRRLIAPR